MVQLLQLLFLHRTTKRKWTWLGFILIGIIIKIYIDRSIEPITTGILRPVTSFTFHHYTTSPNYHFHYRKKQHDALKRTSNVSFMTVSNNDSVDVGNKLKSTSIPSTKTTTTSTPTTTNTGQRTSKSIRKQLLDWANDMNIQISSSIQLQVSSDTTSIDGDEDDNDSNHVGYGWYIVNQDNNNKMDNQVVMTVPSSIALMVESSDSKTNDKSVLPWYVNMAILLCKLDYEQNQSIDSMKTITTTKNSDSDTINYRPWLQSLPRKFYTPIHWDDDTMIQNLQYKSIQNYVSKQRTIWKQYYTTYIQQQSRNNNNNNAFIMSYDQFVWGCECARSRAFTGSYSGSAYNPNIYLFTLLLVTIYIGGNFGTIEQAANGAGIVFATSILKDFVLPKFFKTKRYVICPMIDMTNHDSKMAQGEVAFEYFGNAYSLAITKRNNNNNGYFDNASKKKSKSEQLYISYGPRSNDQLLQYYGFVEVDNPNDVYIMPSIREWDINALELACNRSFKEGRLKILNDAGLLGSQHMMNTLENNGEDDTNVDGGATLMDGVVLSRRIGLDPAILQALRVLVSSDEEWNAAGQSIGNFSIEQSRDNERCTMQVAIKAIEMELASKPTTLEEDQKLLQRFDTMKRMVETSIEEKLAIQFRIEKKKLLKEMIERLHNDLKNRNLN